MKRINIGIIIALLVACAISLSSGIKVTKADEAGSVAPDDKDWKVYWSDEFDGDELDRKTWTPEIGTGWNGWGNGEVQSYTDRPKNLDVKDGKLVITALAESYGMSGYTSARIITRGKKSFKYGKIEAKIKVEGGNQKACWPAFWMMGDVPYQWPVCGELDIMEHANDRPYASGAVHWMALEDSMMWSGMFDGSVHHYKNNKTDGINGWHTYGIVWTKDNIQWYVDNKPYFNVPVRDSVAGTFREKFYLLLNLALSGKGTGYTGFTEPTKNFKKATMYVDYVRVYHNKKIDNKSKDRTDIITSSDIRIAGFQTKNNNLKIRCNIEPEINGKAISSWGILVGSNVNHKLSDNDIVLESGREDIRYIKSYNEDNMEDYLREDLSAKYYAYDMRLGNKQKKLTYCFRPYAIMTDGSYVYGTVRRVSFNDIKAAK